jgi:hypothetical protein
MNPAINESCERPAAANPSISVASARSAVSNTEDELFLAVERKCKINLTFSQKQLVQTYFMKIFRLGKRIDRAEANAVFKNFRHESKFLEKTAEQVLGAGREEGKYWEAKRAELGIMFWASCAVVVLHHDKLEGRFPVLTSPELLEIFPEFRSVSYDSEEMEHLCKYHQVMAATMQAIDPANKKGVLMKVAGRLESASLYVTGGGASKKTKRRVLIYERLCEEGHAKNPGSVSEDSSVSGRSPYEDSQDMHEMSQEGMGMGMGMGMGEVVDDEEEYHVLGCKRIVEEPKEPMGKKQKGQWVHAAHAAHGSHGSHVASAQASLAALAQAKHESRQAPHYHTEMKRQEQARMMSGMSMAGMAGMPMGMNMPMNGMPMPGMSMPGIMPGMNGIPMAGVSGMPMPGMPGMAGMSMSGIPMSMSGIMPAVPGMPIAGMPGVPMSMPGIEGMDDKEAQLQLLTPSDDAYMSEEAVRARELEQEAAQLHEGSLLLLMLTYRPSAKTS